MKKTNFGKIFPLSPPPFRVNRSLAHQFPGGSRSNLFQTSHLHKERMIASEKSVAAAVSESAKQFIGTTSPRIWQKPNAFGLHLGEEGQSPIPVKSILKTPHFESPPLKSTKKGKLTKRLVVSGDIYLPKARHVTFDLKPQFGIAAETERESRVKRKDSDRLNFSKIDKMAGIVQLRLKSPPPPANRKHANFEKESSTEELKVIHGYLYLATDADKANRNTFADPHTNSARGIGESVLRERFYKKINMEGFLDDEICFQTDDSSLIIIGLRPNRDGFNARKVYEVIEFPEGVYHETLLISRDSTGILTIQQYLI